jgi:ribosomal-protein-alanine N-acetyltransferase
MILHSERLTLQPISMNDKEDIFREFTSEITVFMAPNPAKKIEETENFIHLSHEKMERGEEIIFAILKKENNEFLGCAGLHHMDTHVPEFGIWIKKSAHGNGFGLEAVHAIKKWVDENLEYEHIYYPVAKENFASRKIPESMGGKVVREFVGTKHDGTLLDEVEYRIYKK